MNGAEGRGDLFAGTLINLIPCCFRGGKGEKMR